GRLRRQRGALWRGGCALAGRLSPDVGAEAAGDRAGLLRRPARARGHRQPAGRVAVGGVRCVEGPYAAAPAASAEGGSRPGESSRKGNPERPVPRRLRARGGVVAGGGRAVARQPCRDAGRAGSRWSPRAGRGAATAERGTAMATGEHAPTPASSGGAAGPAQRVGVVGRRLSGTDTR